MTYQNTWEYEVCNSQILFNILVFACLQLDCMSRSLSASGFGFTYRASTLSLPRESGLGLGSALGSTTCTALLSDTSIGALPIHTLPHPVPFTALPISAGLAQCMAHAQFHETGEEQLQPLTQHQLRQLDETTLVPECHSASTQSSNGSGSSSAHNAPREQHTDGPMVASARTRLASGQQHRAHRGSGLHDDGSECSCEQCRELLPLTQMQTLRSKTPVSLQLPISSTCAPITFAQSKALTTFAPSPTPKGSQQHLPQGDYLPVARAITPAPRGAAVTRPESVAASMGLWYPSQFSPTRTLAMHPLQQPLLSSAALTLDYSPCHAAALTRCAVNGDDMALTDSLLDPSRLAGAGLSHELASPREPWSALGQAPVVDRAACTHQQMDFSRSLLPLARLDLRGGGCGSAFGSGSDSSMRLGIGGVSAPGNLPHPLSLSRSSTGSSLATQQQLHCGPARPATATANVLRRVPEEQSFVWY